MQQKRFDRNGAYSLRQQTAIIQMQSGQFEHRKHRVISASRACVKSFTQARLNILQAIHTAAIEPREDGGKGQAVAVQQNKIVHETAD